MGKGRKRGTETFGFFTKGKGKNRKVIPLTAPQGRKSTRRVVKRRAKPKGFTINLKYSEKKGDGESLVVIAPDYIKALDEALEEKTDNRKPMEITVIDPSLGEIVRLVGRGAKRAAEIGAKYAIKGGHVAKQAAIKAAPHVKKGVGAVARKGLEATRAVAKYGKAAMIRRAQTRRLKELIERAYSEDRTERIMARLELKEGYPDVYDICDFSKT